LNERVDYTPQARFLVDRLGKADLKVRLYV